MRYRDIVPWLDLVAIIVSVVNMLNVWNFGLIAIMGWVVASALWSSLAIRDFSVLAREKDADETSKP